MLLQQLGGYGVVVVFTPWCGKWQIPCDRWRCRTFYMHPPDRVCTAPTQPAGSLYTAPLPPPASQSPPWPVGLPPGGRKRHCYTLVFLLCVCLSQVNDGLTFFLSLLCLRDFMRCSCFCSFFCITSIICFTPYKALLTSSSISFSPFADNSERGDKNMSHVHAHISHSRGWKCSKNLLNLLNLAINTAGNVITCHCLFAAGDTIDC